MKIILSLFILTMNIKGAYAGHVLKSIESKKTQESITAFCEIYSGDECQLISLKYLHPQNNTETLLFEIEPHRVEEEFQEVQNIIHEMESDQMMKDKYKVLGAFRKVCEIGWNKKKNTANFNDNTGCLLKGLFGSALFIGTGFLVPGAGFALAPALKALAVGGAGASVAAWDLSFVQFFLFYPAIGADVARLATVYPTKKLVNKIQTRNLKRKIIPLLEEMSYEINHPETLKNLENEGLYEHDDYRHSVVKHRHFKKILKYFTLSSEKTK